MALLENHRIYAHIPSLKAINDQLLSRHKDLKDRFMCFGFTKRLGRRCIESAQNFPLFRTVLMRKASDALEKTDVSKEDFVTIVRSLFCFPHSEATTFGTFEDHLKGIWEFASEKTREVFLAEIRQGHKEILEYYASLEGCPVEDVEHAIKTEELPDDALLDISNGDRDNYQIIVYESPQHPLLSSLRESIKSQSMYHGPNADDRESSDEPDANTSGASAFSSSTPSHLETDSIGVAKVDNNHESAGKNTSWPTVFTLASSMEATDDSLAHRPFGSALQVETSETTESHNGHIFPFYSKDFSFESVAPKVAKSPKLVPVETTVSPNMRKPIFPSPCVATKDSALTKESESALNSGFTFGNGTPIPKGVTSERWQTYYGGQSSRSTLLSTTSGNVWVKDEPEENGLGRDNRSRTPNNMTSGFKSGGNSPAQISGANTPTPLGKMKLPGMKQRAVLESPRQMSPSPARLSPNPTTSDRIFGHDMRPTGTATPTKPRALSPREIAYKIKKILREPMDLDNDGYIYVLKAPRFFEKFPPPRGREEPEQWVKIGITRNIEERMISLSGRCGITDLVQCADVHVDPLPMPLLRRVERLCHEELSNFQRPLDCKETDTRCETVHQEWFNVTEEVAIRTVRRWLLFMCQKPYTTLGNLKSGFWEDIVCNGEYLKTLDDEDLDCTHERYQSWLESSIQQYETNIAEERLKKFNV